MVNEQIINWKDLFGPSIVSGIIKVISAGMVFLVLLLLGRTEGPESVGLYSIGVSIVQFLGLLASLGLPTYLMRLAARNYYNGEGVQYNNIRIDYVNSIFISGGVSILISGIIFVYSTFLAENVFHSLQMVSILNWAAITIFPFVMLLIHTELLRGSQHPILAQFLQAMLFHIIILIWLILCIYMGKEKLFEKIMMAYAFASWTIAAASFYFFRLNINIKKKFNYVDLSRVFNFIKSPLSWVTVIKKSSVFLVNGMALTALSVTDIWMLGMLSSTNDVGVYASANKISSVVIIILFSVNNVLAPKLAKIYADKDMNLFSNYINKALMLTVVPSTALTGVLFVWSEDILALFGAGFSSGTVVLQILLVGVLVQAFAGPVGWVLSMSEREKIFQKILLQTISINVVLNFILIPNYGVSGAALATMISTVWWKLYSAIVVYKELDVCTIFGMRLLMRKING